MKLDRNTINFAKEMAGIVELKGDLYMRGGPLNVTSIVCRKNSNKNVAFSSLLGKVIVWDGKWYKVVRINGFDQRDSVNWDAFDDYQFLRVMMKSL